MSDKEKKKKKRDKKNRSPSAKKGHGSERHRKSKDDDSHKRNRSNERKAEKSPKYHEKSHSRNNDYDLSETRSGLSHSWRNRINHMMNDGRKSNNGSSKSHRRGRSRTPDYHTRRHYSPPPRKRRIMLRKRFCEEDYVDEYGHIDKAKLLEIATRNATKLAMEGKLPKGTDLLDTIKNKSIDQLVVLCKKLQDEEDLMEKITSDEDEDYDQKYERWRSKHEDDNEFAPRAVKHSSEIKINITNGNSLPTKTPHQRLHDDSTLRTSFPVSSGIQHRETKTSEWTPVVKAETIVPLTSALSKIKTTVQSAYKSASTSLALFPIAEPVSSLGALFQSTSRTEIGPAIMPPPPEPPKISVSDTFIVQQSSTLSLEGNAPSIALMPPPQAPDMKANVPPLHSSIPMPAARASFDSPGHAAQSAIQTAKIRAQAIANSIKQETTIPAPPPPPSYDYAAVINHMTKPAASTFANSTTSLQCITNSYSSAAQCEPYMPVFKETKGLTKSVSELVALRLKYSNCLRENPNDFEARTKITEIDAEMNEWAKSNHIPGAFGGGTGAKVLSAKELEPLHPRYNAWAKKDLFKNAPEFSGGVGMKLLQKMGWQPGEGLGKEKSGTLEPLMLDVKSDRRGLQSVEDKRVSKRESILDPNGKNPVSVVMEYCAKNRISVPSFECREMGPANQRSFLWKATLNGVEFEPSLPSSNKKAGKSQVFDPADPELEVNSSALPGPSTRPMNMSVKPPASRHRNLAAAAVNTPGFSDMDEHAPLRFAIVLLMVAFGIVLHVFCKFYSTDDKTRSDILYQALSSEGDTEFCVDMDSLDGETITTNAAVNKDMRE
ncbi:g-patch domain-containing protein [Ditylenchus destructor]|nr:g-patch domain-containing protein [Ditylenchus destructor]